MAKAIVLQCDICQVWDSVDNPVATVSIAGPKFDLCSVHRVHHIVAMGIEPLVAAEYVQEFNRKRNEEGRMPTLSGIRRALRKRGVELSSPIGDDSDEDTDEDPEAATEQPPEESEGDDSARVIDLPQGEGDTAKRAPRKRQSAR